MDDDLSAFLAAYGAPPPPPGYGVGTDPPEWYQPDTFTGRREHLRRLRSVLWQTLQRKLAKMG